jgi:hypothetical protein
MYDLTCWRLCYATDHVQSNARLVSRHLQNADNTRKKGTISDKEHHKEPRIYVEKLTKCPAPKIQ